MLDGVFVYMGAHMFGLSVPLIVIIGAVAALALCASYFYERERRQSFLAVARGLEFNYIAAPSHSLSAYLCEFDFLQRGHARVISNMLHGSRHNITWYIFDFRFMSGYSSRQQEFKQTVICAQLAESVFPKFVAFPRYLVSEGWSETLYPEVPFQSTPLFHSMYSVRGKRPQAIRTFFGQRLFRVFEETQQGLCVEAERDGIIFLYYNQLLKPYEVQDVADRCYRMIEMFLETQDKKGQEFKGRRF